MSSKQKHEGSIAHVKFLSSAIEDKTEACIHALITDRLMLPENEKC